MPPRSATAPRADWYLKGRIGPSDTTRRRIAEIAASNFEVVTIDQLTDWVGLTASGVQKRVRSGELHPKYPGVYAFGRADLSPKGHWTAAVMACRPDSCLIGASAAAALQMRRSAASVADVAIPASRAPRRLRGIRCHRVDLAPQDITDVDGIPVTSVARTLLDLASRFDDSAVESAANEAEILGIFDMRAITELLGRSRGKRGVRRLRRVLALGDIAGENTIRTGLERRFVRLCVRAGLPAPATNRWLLLGDEYHQVDCLWREQRTVIEVDSSRYHSTGWKLARDARVSALLEAEGFAHARVHEDQMVADPSGVVELVRSLLALAPTGIWRDK